MWKLTIEDDEQGQTPLTLTHDEYTVGRDSSNSIVLTDRNVSRQHASLRRNATGWLIRDLDSYNGTFVNGLRIEGDQHVGHGDTIQLGDYRLEFRDDKHEAVVQAEATSTVPFHQRPDRLVIVIGPNPGQEFSLDKDYFTIGRSEDAIISINHSSVSRLHAELFAVGNSRFEIIDKDSANGVRINGQEVRRGLLEAGDALELGDVRLRFVGAGKIFRAGLDRQTALPAIVGFSGSLATMGTTPPSFAGTSVQHAPSNRGILKMIILGALLGAVTVGVIAFFLTRWNRPPPTAPTSVMKPEDPAHSLLEEGKRLFLQGYLEDAHQKVQGALERSPSLSDPMIVEIEGKWADRIFAEAEKTSDIEEKKTLLRRIIQTVSVDVDRRKKALSILQSVDPSVEDTIPSAAPQKRAPVGTSAPPPPNATATATASASASPKANVPELLRDPKAQIDAFLSRLSTMNENELKTLIQLCYQESNAACRERATAQLAKLRNQGSGK